MIRFTVYGRPEPAGSKNAGVTKSGRRYVRDSNPNSKDWKRTVADTAGKAFDGRELLTGPLHVTLVFYRPRNTSHYGKKGLLPSAPEWPTTRPDVLKLARAVEDACTGVVWRDDSQIVLESLEKRYGEPARVEITVTATTETEDAPR